MRDSLFASGMPAPLAFPAHTVAPATPLRTHARSAATRAEPRLAALQARLGMPESGNSNVCRQANVVTADA